MSLVARCCVLANTSSLPSGETPLTGETADRAREVITPGGGGDKVSYFPYRDLEKSIRDALRAVYSDVFVVKAASDAEAIKAHGSQIKAVLTRGPLGLYAEEIAALPLLEIICVIGAGYEHVDLQAASNRGIVVTNGAGVNAPSVADHAMALLLSLVRGIPQTDAAVRRHEWP